MSSSDSERGSVVPLINSPKKQKDFDKCIFCQIHFKKVTLTFTENGRKNVTETSELLKHDMTDNQFKADQESKTTKKQLKHHHKNDKKETVQ